MARVSAERGREMDRPIMNASTPTAAITITMAISIRSLVVSREVNSAILAFSLDWLTF
jgi:hypothetical protein